METGILNLNSKTLEIYRNRKLIHTECLDNLIEVWVNIGNFDYNLRKSEEGEFYSLLRYSLNDDDWEDGEVFSDGVILELIIE